MVPLFARPVAEVRALLSTGAPVYLSANPVEYHGPHLSLLTDAIVSRGLIGDVHERLAARHPDWPLLIGAPIEAGAEPVPVAGSRTTPYPAMRGLVLEACRSLWELGARRVVLVTFHGSPLHGVALDAGVRWLESRGVQTLAPLNLAFEEMLALDPSRYAEAFAGVADPFEREAMIRDMAFDFHAGYLETSLALHYAPDSVSPVHRSLPPCPPLVPDARVRWAARIARALGAEKLASELGFAAVCLGWYALRPFPGYTGRPHLATAEAGAVFARFLAGGFAECAERLFAGRGLSPRPILAWLPYATLGGRIGQVRPR